MKRTQVQLDDATYRALKRKAFERGVSMSALLREMLREQLIPAKKRLSLKDFSFVGAGRSDQGDRAPVSENHDAALVEAYME